MADLLLVRYGELALKSPPVRREFERTLRQNLLEQFRRAGVPCRVRSDRGHLYLEVDDPSAAARVARRVFGVTSVSAAREIDTDRAAIRAGVVALADGRVARGRRFAVRARRTGKHDFTSQELAAELGGAVFERWPDLELKVDLETPELELFVEVRGPRTYLYTDRLNGPGGLPLGVAGRVVALVDGARGALGAFLMMKRGCRTAFVVPPSGTPFLREVLLPLDPRAEVVEAPDATASEGTLRALVAASRADGIVLPLVVEDFPAARATWGDSVLFSPTVGLTPEEVEARWQSVRALVT